jgi:hypothetical protein
MKYLHKRSVGGRRSGRRALGRQFLLSVAMFGVAVTAASFNMAGATGHRLNNMPDVFVRDLTNNTTSRVSVSTSGVSSDKDAFCRKNDAEIVDNTLHNCG